MKNVTISRRYASALMLIAKEDGQTDAYRDELTGFATLVENEAGLKNVLVNPLFDRADRLEVLEKVLGKIELTKTMYSFFVLLFNKNRIGYVTDIDEYFQKLADEDKGIARANLVSATELDAEVIENIRGSLSELTGKEVVLDVEQDPGLIGGIVTKIGDLVLDGSIKTQLLSMKESFKKGERV